MITTGAAYLLGSWGNVNTKDTTLCGTTGEDLATLSTKYLIVDKVQKRA